MVWAVANGCSTGSTEMRATHMATATVALAEQRRRRPQAFQADDADLAELCALAESLTARRHALGATAAALASILGISRGTFARTMKIAASKPPCALTPRVVGNARARLLAWLETLNWHATSGAMQTPPTQTPPTRAPVRTTAWPSPLADTPAPLRRLATYRILILENDPDIITIYRLALAEAAYDESYAARYETWVVSTLEECMAALAVAHREGAPFDTLIMDLSVRDLQRHAARPQHSHSNSETTHESCAQRLLDGLLQSEALLPRGRLVVSGMASYHLRQINASLARLGAAYLPKPFDIDALLSGIYSLCAPNARPAASLSYFLAHTVR